MVKPLLTCSLFRLLDNDRTHLAFEHKICREYLRAARRVRQQQHLKAAGYDEWIVLIPTLKSMDLAAQRKRRQTHLVQQNLVEQGLFEREVNVARARFQFDAAVCGELILM